jgi:hypothetical protein
LREFAEKHSAAPEYLVSKRALLVWTGGMPIVEPHYRYKLVVNGERWIEDPANAMKEPDEYGGFNSILHISGRGRYVAMNSTEKTSFPGLIEQTQYSRCELHGFEVDMSGRVIVPEVHPRTPDEVSAFIRFESEQIAAIDDAALAM